MKDGLNELIAAIEEGVLERHTAQEGAVVSGIIKDGFRRLGSA
jgi:hypothetical protein